MVGNTEFRSSGCPKKGCELGAQVGGNVPGDAKTQYPLCNERVCAYISGVGCQRNGFRPFSRSVDTHHQVAEAPRREWTNRVNMYM